MKHKVLLLGIGYWGKKWLPIIMQNPNCELVGVAGSEIELAYAEENYNLKKEMQYTDFKQAITNAKANIAIIVIPAVLHFEAASMALAHNMNVITEKPLANNLEEAEKLLEIKKGHPELKYMASQNYRWRPHNQTLKNAIESGMIGEVRNIHVIFRQHEHLEGFRGGLEQPLLQDMCIHHFDLIRFFTKSNCADIYCKVSRPAFSIFEGQPNADAIITMKNGVTVNYNGTWAARGKESSWDGNFIITGDKGCLYMDDETSVYYYQHDGTGVTPGTKGKLLPQPNMRYKEMEYALYYLIDCIDKNITPETDLFDNYESFKMVCYGRESASKNILIKL